TRRGILAAGPALPLISRGRTAGPAGPAELRGRVRLLTFPSPTLHIWKQPMPDAFAVFGAQAAGTPALTGPPARRCPDGVLVAGTPSAPWVNGRVDMSPTPRSQPPTDRFREIKPPARWPVSTAKPRSTGPS